MSTERSNTPQSMYPVVRYRDAKAAMAWLVDALGFEQHVVYAGEGDFIEHAELKLAGNLIMLAGEKPEMKSPQTVGAATGGVYIALESVDAVYARAKAAGAKISRELTDTDYGSREFQLFDPEGHVWSFGTYRPSAGG